MSSAPLPKKPKLSLEVDDLSIHPQLIQKLKEAKLFTFKAVLHLSEAELQKNVKVSVNEANQIQKAVSQVLLLSQVLSAHCISNEERPYTKHKFSLDLLSSAGDNVDGIYTGTITEICGESGCGKTQVCLHLSIHAQKQLSMGGLDTKVIYIHSEGEFPIKRFMQMADSFKEDNPCFQELNLADNLILKKVFNFQQLMHVLQKGIPEFLNKLNHPKVIIIDSVAAVLRCEYETLSSRTLMIQKLALEVWKLANLYGMAVICVNQVSGSNKSTFDVPSLGLLWSNILTTRIRISRKPSEQSRTLRTLDVVYSSYLPNISTQFTISEAGVKVV
ncbi:hypothetical protein JTE90_012309 [Oedothorax gibbosus]|uniref:RecA family profile 1 domain-containing protein n=1 Tax=Oedothorax gibbosus TaxID=931172 RepID=A0AAV6VKB4_9ARAC|nr:hypothetical protein JTE90_012309 [Oedothorax gibbosus]